MSAASQTKVQPNLKGVPLQGWEKTAGYSNVLRSLAQQSRHSERLLGSNEETKKQVGSRNYICVTIIGSLTQKKSWSAQPGWMPSDSALPLQAVHFQDAKNARLFKSSW